MLFTEKKTRRIIRCLQHPQEPYYATKYMRLTLLFLVISVLLLFLMPSLAGIGFLLTFIFFCIMQKKVNFFGRYDEAMEIKEDEIIITFICGRGRKREENSYRFLISDLDGIEYFTQDKIIAFLTPVVYENGFSDYAIPVDNVFSVNPISYLNEKVMTVQINKSNTFSEKYRND